MCARLRPTPPAAHEELASGLPPALRRVLVDCEPPSAVSAAELAAALSLPPPPPPAASLRSLRMLRMLRGQPPELEPEAETPPFVLREAGVLSHAACAALRAAVDAHLDCNAGCPAEAPAAQVRQHLLASAFSSQLVLDRPALERIIGAPAVQRLWRIPAAVRAGRTEARGGGAGPVISCGAPAATAPPPVIRPPSPALPPSAPSGRGSSEAPFDGEVEVSVRRYSPGSRPWVPFHHDRAIATVRPRETLFDQARLVTFFYPAFHRARRAQPPPPFS